MSKTNGYSLKKLLLTFLFCLIVNTAWAHSITDAALVGTENLQTAQTITWKTDAGEKTFLELRAEGQHPEKMQEFSPKKHLLFTEPGVVQCNAVFLTGLQPDTLYHYRIGSKGKNGMEWGMSSTFHTAKAKTTSFSFLVFGDSQNNSITTSAYTAWGKTCENAYAAHPDAKFFINLGDMVEEGQNYPHWTGWFAGAKNVIDKIPAYPMTGNHESYVPTGHVPVPVEPEFWEAQWPTPANGPADLKGTAYSFDYGSVHFSVLNTQEKEYLRFRSSILPEQREWLEKDLAASSQPWKIVLGHKPFFSISASARHAAPEIAETFGPLIEKYQADLVLNGHEHAIARSDSYPLYYIAGQSGGKTPRNVVQKEPYVFLYNNNNEPNYLYITVTPAEIRIDCIGQAGNLLDSYTLRKPVQQKTA